jgi:cell division protein FtsL
MKDFIVVEKPTLYKMGVSVAILILMLIVAIYEGMQTGNEANKLRELLSIQETKASYCKQKYDTLVESGLCLERIPSLDAELGL